MSDSVITHRDLFSSNFFRVWNDFHEEFEQDDLAVARCQFPRPKWREYWMSGGRSSFKSTFISFAATLGMYLDMARAYRQRELGNPRWKSYLSHTAVYRKVGADLEGSVYNQVTWSLEKLGVAEDWTCRRRSIVHNESGQMFQFRGLDDATKSKSIKAPFGFYKYTWFEELAQFYGMSEIRNVKQSIQRGGHGFITFYSYNPPQTSDNWVNIEALNDVPGRLNHHSTYLDVDAEHRDWIGEDFFIEAEILKKNNPLAYRHELLGEVTGTGGKVFQNLEVREGRPTQAELNSFDRRCFGIDWGFAVDPFVLVCCHFDSTRRILYIFDEVYAVGLRNSETAALVKAKRDIISYNFIWADSAEPKSIADFQAEGLNTLAVSKSPDSVRFGIKWLQSLVKIVVWKGSAPNSAREFAMYEYEKNRDDQFISAYPDKNNHTIDAVRYANEQHITKGGLF